MSMGGEGGGGGGGGGGFASMMKRIQGGQPQGGGGMMGGGGGRPGGGGGKGMAGQLGSMGKGKKVGKGKGRGGKGKRRGGKPQGLEEMMAGLRGEGTAPNGQAFMDRMNGGQAGLPQEQPQQAPQQDYNSYVDEQMKKNPYGADPRTGNNMYGGRADSSITQSFGPEQMWGQQQQAPQPVESRMDQRQAQARPQMSLPSERGGGGGGNAIMQARRKHRRQAGLGR